MLTAPSAGGLQIHSQRTNFDTNRYVTQINHKADLQPCPNDIVVNFYVHAPMDAAYPTYRGAYFPIANGYGKSLFIIEQD